MGASSMHTPRPLPGFLGRTRGNRAREWVFLPRAPRVIRLEENVLWPSVQTGHCFRARGSLASWGWGMTWLSGAHGLCWPPVQGGTGGAGGVCDECQLEKSLRSPQSWGTPFKRPCFRWASVCVKETGSQAVETPDHVFNSRKV